LADLSKQPAQRTSFGIVGVTITGVGALQIVIAFTGAKWFGGANGAGFAQTHNILEIAEDSANGVASAYFSWLGWAIFALAVVDALLASSPTQLARPMRFIAPLVAVAGIVLTTAAINLGLGASFGSWFDNVSLGYWLAVIGFALIGVGAAFGPWRAAGQLQGAIGS
jgi:hypothetical protein